MTRTQAIEIYLKNQVHSKEIIRRLMLWDEKLSIPDNARKMKISESQVRDFAKKCGLKYRLVGKGNNYRGVNPASNSQCK